MGDEYSLKETLTEVRDDVKEILQKQAATEERLRMGAEKFQDHGKRIKDLECKPEVRPGTVYTLVGLILTILMVLISVLAWFS